MASYQEHFNRATILKDTGDYLGAIAEFESCMRASPGNVGPLLDIGWIYEELGDFHRAEYYYRQAIEKKPSYCLPHARLGTLLRGKLPDNDLMALNDQLNSPTIAEDTRVRIYYALAAIYDSKQQWKLAAEAITKAKELSPDETYSIEHHDKFLAHLKSMDFINLRFKGLFTHKPIFIVGFPRSGTTLLEQVLSTHPHIHGAGELVKIESLFKGLTPETIFKDLCTIAEDYLQELTRHDPGEHRYIIDKLPGNYLYLNFIRALFPLATILHCRRDIRDVAVSCWLTDFKTLSWASKTEHLTHRINSYKELMNHWAGTIPKLNMIEVQYENYIQDIESITRQILTNLQLDWEPNCLSFHKTVRPVKTASVTQVRQPVYSSSVNRWMNYQEHLPNLFEGLHV